MPLGKEGAVKTNISSLRDITEEQCLRIQQWMNAYLRRILDYDTPYERFVRAFHQERLAN